MWRFGTPKTTCSTHFTNEPNPGTETRVSFAFPSLRFLCSSPPRILRLISLPIVQTRPHEANAWSVLDRIFGRFQSRPNYICIVHRRPHTKCAGTTIFPHRCVNLEKVYRVRKSGDDIIHSPLGCLHHFGFHVIPRRLNQCSQKCKASHTVVERKVLALKVSSKRTNELQDITNDTHFHLFPSFSQHEQGTGCNFQHTSRSCSPLEKVRPFADSPVRSTPLPFSLTGRHIVYIRGKSFRGITWNM